MNQTLQPPPLVLIIKDLLRNRLPIYLTVGPEHFSPPPLLELLPNLRPKICLAHSLIGIDYQTSLIFEDSGDIAFATADATDDADDGFAREHLLRFYPINRRFRPPPTPTISHKID